VEFPDYRVTIAGANGLLARLLLLTAFGLALAAGVTSSSSNAAPGAAGLLPGVPDPRLMVLRVADLPAGARVAHQRYFTDVAFDNAVSYTREFDRARIGRAELLELESLAEVGGSVGSARAIVGTVRTLFGSKRGRATLKKQIAAAVAEEDGVISNFEFGRPRNLGSGDESFDITGSFRVLGLRVEFHFAVVRVDRVVGLISVVGEPRNRVSFSGVRRLAAAQVAHTRRELAPRNLAPPTVTGAAAEGQTLTATAGTWKGSPKSFAYQWQRCDSVGANCSNIAGAAGATYLLTTAERGFTIRVAVTARSPYGSASAVSAPTAVIAAATGAPVSTAPPAVVGTPQQGQTLSASTGSWTGAPTGFAYQWERCDSAGANCAAVAGASGPTYVVTSADVGFRLRVVVTATNAGGAGTSASAPTAPVT
jgi:hypothetical protein